MLDRFLESPTGLGQLGPVCQELCIRLPEAATHDRIIFIRCANRAH